MVQGSQVENTGNNANSWEMVNRRESFEGITKSWKMEPEIDTEEEELDRRIQGRHFGEGQELGIVRK